MAEANLSDTEIIFACLQRSLDRIVIKLAKHYNVHPAQIEGEEEQIYHIKKTARVSDKLRNDTIAKVRGEIKKTDAASLFITLFQKRQKQANQELLHLCASISKRHNLGFNGEPKELLVQLEIEMNEHPELRENKSLNAVYMELKATFPQISTAIMIDRALQHAMSKMK